MFIWLIWGFGLAIIFWIIFWWRTRRWSRFFIILRLFPSLCRCLLGSPGSLTFLLLRFWSAPSILTLFLFLLCFLYLLFYTHLWLSPWSFKHRLLPPLPELFTLPLPRHLRLDIVILLSDCLQRQLLPERLRLYLQLITTTPLFIHHHLWHWDVPLGDLPWLLKLVGDLESLHHWVLWGVTM